MWRRKPEGEETFYRKFFPFLNISPSPLFKDFDFIESLFILLGMDGGRPVDEESAVLKIFGAFWESKEHKAKKS